MREPVIGTKSGFLAISLCAAGVVGVLIFGALFSTSYRSECSRDELGKRTCTEHLEFLGWAGIPLQPIASAVGIGAGVFVALARCKSPSEVVEYLAKGKSDADVSSQD